MLALVKPFITKYLLYIKVAVVVAALATSAWAGHEWTKRGFEAAQARAVTAAVEEYKDSVERAERKAQQLMAANAESAVRFQTQVAALQSANHKLRKKIKNVEESNPPCQLSAGFVGVYNSSIQRANAPMSAPVGDSAALEGTDGRASSAGIGDVLANHDAVMTICGKWKAQLDEIHNLYKQVKREDTSAGH